jgi:glycosyltransferase involved in cell wall biosynthesis
MKILYLVDFLRTAQAGTEKQLGHLLTSLPVQGHAVGLASLQSSPFLSEEAQVLFPDVDFISFGANSDISRTPMSLVHLRRHLVGYQPDIVHTFFPTSNSIGAVMARLSGVRTVITSRRDMGFNLTRKDIILLKTANRTIEYIVANSLAVKKHTAEQEGFPPSRIHVVHNGIDAPPPGEKRPLPTAHPIVGIVANLNRPVKRVEVFIRSAAQVHRNFPETRFWIVGEGHLRDGLETLARQSGLGDAIQFLGRRKDVETLLNHFTAGVICSDSEGLSNAIMEYMAAGIPTVATDTGGNSELIRHGKTGYLVPPGNHEALAEALSALLSAPNSACAMGIEAQNEINRNFSVSGMVTQTAQIYADAIRIPKQN